MVLLCSIPHDLLLTDSSSRVFCTESFTIKNLEQRGLEKIIIGEQQDANESKINTTREGSTSF